MTPERLIGISETAANASSCHTYVLQRAIDECLDEIERLRGERDEWKQTAEEMLRQAAEAAKGGE